eukprot:GHVS01038570.1.p1 GENE.GHVS01038570.1~~GHVS01038570.1.p1  ORF type:complete len:283 (-),score=76.73 GHVS01038570.1:1692-2540(-)
MSVVTFEAGHIYRPGKKEEVRLVYRIRGGPDNGRHQKSFSITRYGLEGAFAVAEQAKEYINSTNRLPLDFYNPYSVKNIASTFHASSLEPQEEQPPPPSLQPNRKRKQQQAPPNRGAVTTTTPKRRQQEHINNTMMKEETAKYFSSSPIYYPESTASTTASSSRLMAYPESTASTTASSSPLMAPICFVQYLPSSPAAVATTPFSFYHPYATPFQSSPTFAPLPPHWGAEEFLFSPVLNSSSYEGEMLAATKTEEEESQQQEQQQPTADDRCSSPVRLSALL